MQMLGYVSATMTSAQYNVGFTNDRNSSRVLKPPGGGHTKIFGVDDEEVTNRNTTSQKMHMKSSFSFEDDIKPAEKKAEQQGNGETASVSTCEVKKDEGGVEKPAELNSNQRRGRVPPGGFSTGFW